MTYNRMQLPVLSVPLSSMLHFEPDGALDLLWHSPPLCLSSGGSAGRVVL